VKVAGGNDNQFTDMLCAACFQLSRFPYLYFVKTFRRILRFFGNKYVYTTLAFLVWMVAFDSNNMLSQYRLTSELKMLEAEKEHYLAEIRKDSLAMSELMSSLENLEKYGRERYLMKKDNEEVYLIVRKKKDGSTDQ
jgi:cell division protein FtsB